MGGYIIVFRRISQYIRVILLFAATSIIFSGCQEVRRYVVQEHLFSIEPGKAEHTIDLFHSASQPFDERSDIYMRDGLIWLVNRNANKIMTFTSYGDLVGLLFDPDENPVPASLPLVRNGSAGISSRRAIAYEFHRIGWFSVDSHRRILVEDLLPQDRWQIDAETGAVLNRVVLRFSPSGELIDYIGQDGPRGEPFPHIQHVITTSKDELVVVSRIPDRWLVYWFLPDGEHLSTIEIPVERLPIPAEGYIPSLQEVLPDPEMHRIYIKIDYYRKQTEGATAGVQRVEQSESRVYWLDLSDAVYEQNIEIPPNRVETRESTILNPQTRNYPYVLLGILPDNHLLFMSEETDDRVQLLLMHTSGRVVRRRSIEIPSEAVLYRRLRLTDSGILTGALLYEDGADILWWRTDSMLPHGL